MLGYRRKIQHLQAARCARSRRRPRTCQADGAGLPLARQDASSGALTAASIGELQAAMASAAACEDFRVAAQLKTMLDVLGPRTADELRTDLEQYTSADASAPGALA